MKISKKASVILSLVLVAIMSLVMLAALFLIPAMVKHIIPCYYDNGVGYYNKYQIIKSITEGTPLLIGGLIYFLDILGLTCLASLLVLLLNIRKGEVFTVKNVFFLRLISWLCIFAALGFGAVGLFFPVSYYVMIVSGFFGINIRVVKNVIEEATVIKSENDLTV